jgi:hypothetical protein
MLAKRFVSIYKSDMIEDLIGKPMPEIMIFGKAQAGVRDKQAEAPVTLGKK